MTYSDLIKEIEDKSDLVSVVIHNDKIKKIGEARFIRISACKKSPYRNDYAYHHIYVNMIMINYLHYAGVIVTNLNQKLDQFIESEK